MIRVECPTRVDLAGGTLDLWPLYSFLKSTRTINIAIDIMTRALLSSVESQQISIHIPGFDYDKKFDNLQSFLSCEDPEIEILKPPIEFFHPKDGFELTIESESPIGGGLGGSSSLMIAVCEAFLQFTGKSFSELEKVHLAHNLEAQLLKTPTGTQDYFAPILKSGLIHIQYSPSGIEFKVQSIPKEILDHFLLVYTGKPHHSGLNNWEVFKSIVDGDQKTLNGLREIQSVSDCISTAIQEGDWSKFSSELTREYESRVQLAKAFASPEIQNLRSISKASGADEIKICGAGGGGCVMIWVSPDKRKDVVDSCKAEGFQVLNAKPVQR